MSLQGTVPYICLYVQVPRVLGSLFSWQLSWCHSPVWNSGGSGSGEEILTLDVSSKQKTVKFFPDLPREYTTFLTWHNKKSMQERNGGLIRKKVRCRWVVGSNIGIGTMKGWELAKQDGCGVVGGSFHPNIVYSANFFWDFFSGHRVFFAEGQVFKSGDWNSRQYTYNNISINVCRNKVLLKLGRWLYNPSSTLKPALLQVPRQFHGVCCLVAVKPGDIGRYRRISQEPEKKNRKAHDNSTIICAKLKFFYLCDGYDLEIRITIWWVCERIIIEHCTWCVFSPKKVCVLVFFPLQLMFSPQRNVVDFPVKWCGFPLWNCLRIAPRLRIVAGRRRLGWARQRHGTTLWGDGLRPGFTMWSPSMGESSGKYTTIYNPKKITKVGVCWSANDISPIWKHPSES